MADKNDTKENWGKDFDKLVIMLAEELGIKLKVELISSSEKEQDCKKQ